MKRILTLVVGILIFFSHLADAQVVLNEIKVKPKLTNSSPPNGFYFAGGEEYVELYNNSCTPVNLNGFYIATRQEFGGATAGGTLRLPNVVIQPKSHLLIAPSSAAPAEDIDVVLTTSNVPVCTYGRSFPILNIDSWIALYDNTGTPIDGVYWTSTPGNLNTQLGDFGGTLCIPAGSSVSSLPNAQQIGNIIMKYVGGNFVNNSDSLLSRQIDGTGNWVRNLPSSIRKSNPTKNCNGGNCFTPTPNVTGFSYAAPACEATSATPITAANFTPGGTYTAFPVGLSINPFTGVINISGSTPGIYTVTYAVTASGCSGGGSSTASIIIPNCCTSVPTINQTLPTCSSPGTSSISNYNSSLTYIFNPAGPTVGTGGVIIGMIIGVDYTVRASNGSCDSNPSASFSNSPQLPTLSPNLTCASSTTSSVTFGWNAVSGATSYSVRYQVNGGAFTPILNVTTNSFTTGSTPAINPGDNVRIEVTPIGVTGSCFNTGILSCSSNICPPLNAGEISGNSLICKDSTTTLFTTNFIQNGIWSSVDTSIARVDSLTGEVTGGTPGKTTILYTVKSSDPACLGEATQTYPITVVPIPTPKIKWNGTQLYVDTTDGSYSWYTWFLNDGSVVGFSDAITPTANGIYKVMAYSVCTAMSEGYNFIATNVISFSPSSSKSLIVYPNPAQHHLWVKLDRKPGERMELQVFNAVGRLVKSLQSGQQQVDLNVEDLPAGTYFIRVSAPGYLEVKKIQIAR